MRWSLSIALLVAAAVLQGCGSSTATTKGADTGSSGTQDRSTGELRFEARLHHATADRTVIYFKLHTADLLYKSQGGGGPFRSNVTILYEAYPIGGGKNLLDSASTFVRDQADASGRDQELVGSFELKRTPSAEFLLKVIARDENRDVSEHRYLRVNAPRPGDRHSMLPFDPRSGVPLFDDHLAFTGPVAVKCETCGGRPLWVDHRPRTVKLPPPVFTQQRTPVLLGAPDTLYQVMPDEQGNYVVQMPDSGALLLRTDTALVEGLMLHAMGAAYPTVRTVDDMLAPLRYITSMQEWDRIDKAGDRRRALEKFWTDAAGDQERARGAIRAFYSRVETANREFTSVAEGWRTDRGLVYIIFGPPSNVRRTDKGEVWTYGEENNLMSLSFSFKRREDGLTDNDYELDRDPMFKGAWYRNVESWRNGRIQQH
ncbi:MAG: GWxTD domain-containing protein [Flavobacteriales bacterium]|nr:GWxTD domain-containing protein [Flavobacteriales bacterium]